MRVLITGMSGFAGQHLQNLLLRETYWTLFGLSRNTDGARPSPRVFWWKLDLEDADGVARFMRHERPDIIVHLAGQSHVPTSWEKPWETFETNVHGQLNLFQGVIAAQLAPRMLIITSNEIYGAPSAPDDVPFRETRLPQPNNPYAVSKVAADAMALQYRNSHGFDVVVARPFNHTGPGHAERFVLPGFARQIAEIEAGQREPLIKVGNMAAQRDFSDGRDVAAAYLALIKHGVAGEIYNVCSGQARSIATLFDMMCGMSQVEIRTETDPAKFRPVDTPISYGDNTKLRLATGWQPSIPIEQTLQDLLTEARSKVAGVVR